MSSAASALRERAFRSELDQAVQQPVVDHRVIERVRAGDRGRDVVLQDRERDETALHRRDLAQTATPVVAPDAQEAAASGRRILRAPLDLECLDSGDAHAGLLSRRQ